MKTNWKKCCPVWDFFMYSALAAIVFSSSVFLPAQETALQAKKDENENPASAKTQYYIGVVQGKAQVSVVSRIPGTISEVAFKDGTIVKEGDLLYEIDNPVYIINVKKREAVVRRCEAELEIATLDFKDKKASGESEAAIMKAELTLDVLRSKLDEAKCDLELASVELSYTKIHTPMTGRIGTSRHFKGANVTAGTSLATVIQVTPITVSFSIKDSSLSKYLEPDGGFNKSAFGNIMILGMNDVPYEGKCEVDSIDNSVDRTTGTVTVTLTCENPEGKLFPGAIVKIKIVE